MWISDPTPVISSTKHIDSWSICRPKSTWRLADRDPAEHLLVDDAVVAVPAEHLGEQAQAHPERRERGGAAQQVSPRVGAPAAEQQDRGARQGQCDEQPGVMSHLGGVSL